MANISMDRLRELCRAVTTLPELGIAAGKKYGVSRSTLYRLRARLKECGFSRAGQTEVMSDQALAELVCGKGTVLAESGGGLMVCAPRQIRIDPQVCLIPDFKYLARYQEEARVQTGIMYRSYLSDCKEAGKSALSRSTFYDRLKHERVREKRINPKMYSLHPYGAELMIDYCGDRKDLKLCGGTVIRCAVIVLTWPASHYTWARYITGMTTAETVGAICEALRTWQVKPALSFVIDNAKSMVTKHSTGAEAVLNSSFEHFCRQIKVEVDANNPYSPSSKSACENGVRLVQDRVLPELDGGLCLSLEGYNRRLSEAVDRLINSARMTGRNAGATRKELFELYEKPRAAKLEGELPEFTEYFTGIKIPPTYLIEFRKVLYSVPCKYIGKYADLEITGRRLRILHNGKIIAEWEIMPEGSAPQILPEHMPEAHRKVKEKKLKYPDAETVLAAAGSLSAALATACRGILNAKGFVNGKKGCIRLISIYRRAPWMREIYDDACTRMMTADERTWSSYAFLDAVKDIRGDMGSRNGRYEKQTSLPIDDGYYSRGPGAFGGDDEKQEGVDEDRADDQEGKDND
jgi:predicted DNA-binding transcriptional regulator AlpA